MDEFGETSRLLLMHQPTQLRKGMTVMIKNSKENIQLGEPQHEIFTIASANNKTKWFNVIKPGETTPKCSRKLVPGGRWWVHTGHDVSNQIEDMLKEITIDSSLRATPEMSSHRDEGELGPTESVTSQRRQDLLLPQERSRDNTEVWSQNLLDLHSLESHYLDLPFLCSPNINELRQDMAKFIKLPESTVLDKICKEFMSAAIELGDDLEEFEGSQSKEQINQFHQKAMNNFRHLSSKATGFIEWLSTKYVAEKDKVSACRYINDKFQTIQAIHNAEIDRCCHAVRSRNQGLPTTQSSSPKLDTTIPGHMEIFSGMSTIRKKLIPDFSLNLDSISSSNRSGGEVSMSLEADVEEQPRYAEIKFPIKTVASRDVQLWHQPSPPPRGDGPFIPNAHPDDFKTIDPHLPPGAQALPLPSDLLSQQVFRPPQPRSDLPYNIYCDENQYVDPDTPIHHHENPLPPSLIPTKITELMNKVNHDRKFAKEREDRMENQIRDLQRQLNEARNPESSPTIQPQIMREMEKREKEANSLRDKLHDKFNEHLGMIQRWVTDKDTKRSEELREKETQIDNLNRRYQELSTGFEQYELRTSNELRTLKQSHHQNIAREERLRREQEQMKNQLHQEHIDKRDPYRGLTRELATVLAHQKQSDAERVNQEKERVNQERATDLIHEDENLTSTIKVFRNRFVRSINTLDLATDDEIKTMHTRSENDIDHSILELRTKAAGVRKLAALVNMLDDPSITDTLHQARVAETEANLSCQHVKLQMKERGLRTNAPDPASNKIPMPKFSGSGTVDVYAFEEKIRKVLEAKSVPTIDRPGWVIENLTGSAQSLVKEIYKNTLMPEWDELFSVLRRHFGSTLKIMNTIKEQHSTAGKVPLPNQGASWDKIHAVSTKHLDLMRNVERLSRLASNGILKADPLDAGYINFIETFLTQTSVETIDPDNYYDELSDVGKLTRIKNHIAYVSTLAFSNKFKSEEGRKKKDVEKTSRPNDDLKHSMSMPTSNPPKNAVLAVNQAIQQTNPTFTGNPPAIPPSTTSNPPPTKSAYPCFACKEVGHFSRDCPKEIGNRYYCDICKVYGGNHTTQYCFKNPSRNAPNQRAIASTRGMTDPSVKPAADLRNLTPVLGTNIYQTLTTCELCRKMASVNDEKAADRVHYYTTNGRLEKHLCPEITDRPTIEERYAIIMSMNMCPACLQQDLSVESHAGQPCTILLDEKMQFLKCKENTCRLRSVLCVDHKHVNKEYLSGETQRAKRLNLNICFVAVNNHMAQAKKKLDYNHLNPTAEQLRRVMDQVPNAIPPLSCQATNLILPGCEVVKNATFSHLFDNAAEMCESAGTVRELPEGTPHFLLFMMKGMDNSRILTVFDTAASYSLMKTDILGKKIQATEIQCDARSAVGGLGGVQWARNFLALLPLYGCNEYQMTSCQAVPQIVNISTADTRGLLEEITRAHPGELSDQVNLPNFADLGQSIEVEALIGLNDMQLHPKLVLETKLGINVYWTPMQAAGGFTQFCIGGNIPSLEAAQYNIVADNTLTDRMINCYTLSKGIYRDHLGTALITYQEIEQQYKAMQSNLSQTDFLGHDENHIAIEVENNISDLDDGEEATNCLAAPASQQQPNSEDAFKEDVCKEHNYLFYGMYNEAHRHNSLLSVKKTGG